jgi:DNA (cytosine-5)-methyltransferase 1
MNEIKKNRVISLFSGAGGLDLGLVGGFEYLGVNYSENPFEIILANDINEKAVITQNNYFSKKAVCKDVIELLEDDLPKADLLVGGFPCQDFSLAGKQQGLESDRGNLYKAMITALEKVKPKIFIAENVKGLLIWKDGLAIKTIVKDFEKCGYTVDYELLNAADFGVPQIRERVIIVGIRNDIDKKFKWPLQTHFENPSDNQNPWVTIKNALEDLEDEEKHNKLPNSAYSKAKKNKGQGNKVTLADKPSPTMRAEHHGNIEFHYKLERRLSAREAARIQSFPDNFEFFNSTTDAYRQIGNAVPPVLAWHLAQSIGEVLNDNS